MRNFCVIPAALIMAMPISALADDCAAPPRPVFEIAGEDLDVAGFTALTEMLIEFDEQSIAYRNCLDVAIEAREEGWVDALGAYNQASATQTEVYERYVEVSDEFLAATEKRAAEAAEDQRVTSEEMAEAHLEALSEEPSASDVDMSDSDADDLDE